MFRDLSSVLPYILRAGAIPDVVTTSFTAGYVVTSGVAIAVGRFGWASASDLLGRRNAYKLFSLGFLM